MWRRALGASSSSRDGVWWRASGRHSGDFQLLAPCTEGPDGLEIGQLMELGPLVPHRSGELYDTRGQ
jgi:hypothetical protein